MRGFAASCIGIIAVVSLAFSTRQDGDRIAEFNLTPTDTVSPGTIVAVDAKCYWGVPGTSLDIYVVGLGDSGYDQTIQRTIESDDGTIRTDFAVSPDVPLDEQLDVYLACRVGDESWGRTSFRYQVTVPSPAPEPGHVSFVVVPDRAMAGDTVALRGACATADGDPANRAFIRLVHLGGPDEGTVSFEIVTKFDDPDGSFELTHQIPRGSLEGSYDAHLTCVTPDGATVVGSFLDAVVISKKLIPTPADLPPAEPAVPVEREPTFTG